MTGDTRTQPDVDALRQAMEALEQIAIVCTDNMDRGCDHRMALDFVREIANRALAHPSTLHQSPTPEGKTP